MIAACPKCQAKYRVDPMLLGPSGARLRCAKCQAVFRVRAPEQRAPAATQAPPLQPQLQPQPPAPAPPASAPASGASPPPAMDRERIVLVADPDVEAGKELVSELARYGLQPVLVHDGVEALLTIQRMLPRAVILDAALPKMYGFQVCEIVKRNESLRSIHVVLVGSVHHQDRYRRPPSELYGADVYVEKPELLTSLEPTLRGFGYDLAGAAAAHPSPAPPAAPSPAPLPPAPQPPMQPAPAPAAPLPPAPQPLAQPAPAPAAPLPPAPQPLAQPAPAPPAPPQSPPDDDLAQQRADAERLARVIVSDIVLYHPEQFEAGLGSGQLAQALAGAIEEGRGFFAQRVDARVCDEKDYLMEELLRVGRSRTGQ
jgi:predicted Zn finger-like uncharacterized protein